MPGKMLQKFPYFLLFISFYISSCVTSKNIKLLPDKNLLQKIDQSFQDAALQYRLMIEKIPADKFPKNYNPKTLSLEITSSDWWCSGFYPGTLLYLYSQTGYSTLYNEAISKLNTLEKEKNNTSTHDLGFMMNSSFGNAEKLTPKPEYKSILLQSAKSLSTRFNPVVGCIRSWNSRPSEFLVIIDNMMNLELLFWATHATGDSSFYKIAVTHADNTLKNHFRADNSSYHVVNYNPVTGVVQQKRTAQGAGDESAWARGQAWGLYGFTVMYRETKNIRYLNKAEAIAQFILDNPQLPADKIPYWDFNAPDIPNALRDASAAAIIASALLELCRYTTPSIAKKYFTSTEIILKSLLSAKYKSAPGANGGFIIQHCVGNCPQGTEVDVSLTYADYYFIEAMIRYKSFQK